MELNVDYEFTVKTIVHLRMHHESGLSATGIILIFHIQKIYKNLIINYFYILKT